MNLDYDDQCDLVYGRLRRLADKDPKVLTTLQGLDTSGLGVSGNQVDMVVAQLGVDLKLRALLRRVHVEIGQARYIAEGGAHNELAVIMAEIGQLFSA